MRHIIIPINHSGTHINQIYFFGSMNVIPARTARRMGWMCSGCANRFGRRAPTTARHKNPLRVYCGRNVVMSSTPRRTRFQNMASRTVASSGMGSYVNCAVNMVHTMTMHACVCSR